MNNPKNFLKISGATIPDLQRSIIGFSIGTILMYFVSTIFLRNMYDFNHIRDGIEVLFKGGNPYGSENWVEEFFNPPYAVIFLWPMLYLPQYFFFILGGGLLFAIAFYYRAWVGLAWFLTNSFLYIVAAGGINMYVMGSGLILLFIGDKYRDKFFGLIIRVIAYGFLLVKPQGGLFIVGLYILTRFDWQGTLLSLAIYYLPFSRIFGDWVRLLLTTPPLSQTVASQSIAGKYGYLTAIVFALVILFSRRWNYWQLGGALAAILPPYGMPGIPIFIILTAVRRVKYFVLIVIFSGALAAITWISPPPNIEHYTFVNPLMAIYTMVMIMVTIFFACHQEEGDPEKDPIDARGWLKSVLDSTH